MKWKIWTLFNNWFSVINNLKIFYKESQTQYFTNFALFFFVFFFFFFKLHLYKRMERRHGLVPRKEGAKSSTHTNIHTHTRTRKKRKTKKKKRENILTSDLKLINSAVFLYFFKLHWKFDWIYSFFFLSKLLLLFFSHTCQTWSHSTRLQTTESHTHVSFPHRRTNTKGRSEGRWRGRETLRENPH